MDINKLISIIIPCYNDWRYVEQAVDSALNQTYPYKEVIVVDDGSDAKTKAVLKSIEPKITKLITQENQGQSKARNIGIAAALGEYILVLDSDDFFEPRFCEKAITLFLANQSVKIVTCKAKLLYESGKTEIYKPRGGDIKNFIYANDAMGSCMFKKEDWVLCDGYDEHMRNGFEDWEFYIRILKYDGFVNVINEFLFNYRRRINSTTKVANNKKYELLKYIYIKHQDLYKNDFDSFVTFMLNRIEREEIEKLKNLQRIEYKIGKIILAPFRWFKCILNK